MAKSARKRTKAAKRDKKPAGKDRAESDPVAVAMARCNPKQQKFLLNIFASPDLNATRAYIEAGYSKRGACQGAHRLLRSVKVKAAYDAILARDGITADAVRVELAKIVQTLLGPPAEEATA